MQDSLEAAVRALRGTRHAVAFTGAGISVESGIPTFRGPDGIWSRYDPESIELGFFHADPHESWRVIKEIFYDYFDRAEPNAAHVALADLEDAGVIQEIVTQNIDGLHQAAGSRRVWEFHGTSRRMICLDCETRSAATDIPLDTLPPRCPDCGGLLKPDFIFFGEGIPEPARTAAFRAAASCDAMLVIGSTGEVAPASLLPGVARDAGATIIEINPEPSLFTDGTTDIFLQGKASVTMTALVRALRDGGDA